jgi:quercetin dioxygenase-like cupin family protein
MAGIQKKQFSSATDVRPFKADKGELRMIDLDGPAAGKATFQPGWRWSEHVKPIAGTDSCQAPHLGYVLSGQMTIRMDDGTEDTINTGDFVSIAPGHDAWVVGDEPCVMLDWQGYADYAKPKAGAANA